MTREKDTTKQTIEDKVKDHCHFRCFGPYPGASQNSLMPARLDKYASGKKIVDCDGNKEGICHHYCAQPSELKKCLFYEP